MSGSRSGVRGEMERACMCVWGRLGSNTGKEKEKKGRAWRSEGHRSDAKEDKQTSHAQTYSCTRGRARARAAHHTLNQSAMDKKIMPLSFPGMFYAVPPHLLPPIPPHQNTVCLSLSVSSVVCLCVCGLRLGCPDPPQLRLYKPCVPKAAHWAHHSGPPSLKRCCLTGLTSPSLQESLFVSQLASCCILAIWHRRDALTASNKQLLLTVNNAIPGNDSPFGYFCSLSLIKETFL